MVLLLGLVGAAFYYRATVAAERRLQKAMAEADRLDPGWRLDDILRNQPAIPDEDNGALRRMTVERLLPAGLGSLFSSVASIRPQVQLSANLIASLRTKLQESPSAVEAARRLSQEKEGHIPITLGRNRYSTVLPPLMSSLDVARLLSLDATLLAQDQELDKAVDSCRAILGTGRTVGEGPYLMATLVRVSIALITQRSLERILAQGVTTEGDLADVQHFLEEEAGRPFLLNALRGERAGVDLMFEGLERAEIKVTDVVPLLPDWSHLVAYVPAGLYCPLLCGSIKDNRAACLECFTRMIEIAKLPPRERTRRTQELSRSIDAQPWLARQFLWIILAGHWQQVEAEVTILRTSVVALAAERYRLVHGRWPDTLEALVPQYLSQVPDDPFVDGPLRLRRLDDGLVVYSVGPDGIDNGGNIGTGGRTRGTDLGFRLWDVKERRQPAAEAESEKSKTN
jgi:hypothetical protein